jgi:hypothetical protein
MEVLGTLYEIETYGFHRERRHFGHGIAQMAEVRRQDDHRSIRPVAKPLVELDQRGKFIWGTVLDQRGLVDPNPRGPGMAELRQ